MIDVSMIDYSTYFNGKKITVMGLGLLGRALGDAKFLAEHGAKVIVTDLKTEMELESSVKELRNFPNVTFHLGGHNLEDFRNRDFILKAAGVPIESAYVTEARKNGVPIEMSTSLFARFSPATIIGITGTRGKSTVTHLLHEILKNGYKNGRVFIGGNVRGVSTLPLLPTTVAGDIVVMELDSWQLQGFGESKISPHLSIFTTFYPDHLNYYKNNPDQYLDDKFQIFKYQKPEDFLIVGDQAAQLIAKRYASEIKSKMIVAGLEDFPKDWQIIIPGDHNKYDAAIAIIAARTLGISEDIIKKTIAKWRGVPGRLELVSEKNGIKIYNDTTATTPDATIVALKALGRAKNIILIIGGSDKNLDMTGLLGLIPDYCKKLIILPGTGTDRIMKDIEAVNVEKVFTKNLEESVAEAVGDADKSDIILFSPAFASFGYFKNEFDRGEQFMKFIGVIK